MQSQKSGFTLIELLVVVTILAILSLAGIAAFRNTTGNARDAKRKADVDAIAKAYETKFDPNTSTYPVLEKTDFTSGSIPITPEGGNYYYTLPSPAVSFKVCAVLEAAPASTTTTTCKNATTTPLYCYCRKSSQSQ